MVELKNVLTENYLCLYPGVARMSHCDIKFPLFRSSNYDLTVFRNSLIHEKTIR
jgi:hypothetical protein